MTGLIMKLIGSPLVVYLSSLLFPRLIDFTALYQPIAVGIIIALVGHVMELLLLKKGTVWISTALDFGAAFIVLYLSSFIFPGARVTVTGAMITAAIIAIAEHLQHMYLVKVDKTVKS